MVRGLAERWWRAEVIVERKVGCRSKLTASIAVLAVFAFACIHGSGDPNSRYENLGDADGPRHFVVLPINLTIKTSPEFSPVLDEMFGAIAGYIRHRGNTLETLSRQDATADWKASIKEVKKSDALDNNFKSAMRVFVARLAGTTSFDALIVPSIVYRDTKIRERTIKWDGVFRKMKIVNVSDEARKKGLSRSVSVEIAGVSLHVMVFDPGGDLVFQKYGGLDLAHDVDMANVEFTMAPKLSLKEDLLKDSDYVREGIGEAFAPFLPKR